MDFSILTQLPAGLIAMLGGILLLYAAAQSLSGAVPQAFVDSPKRRAFWHAGPIAAAAVVAACLGHGEMALGILTGCSVAALSLAPGVCRVLSSTRDNNPQDSPIGVLLLGPTLMLWLIGLRAEINWLAGAFLAVQGILLLWIWREPYGSKRPSILKGVIFILATGVAVVAAVLAIRGAVRLHDDLPTLTPGIFSAGIIAPLLILPMLGESVRLTEEHRAGDARTMQIGIAIINLAIILPLCVLASYLAPHFFPASGSGALSFSVGTWRVDSVILVILSAWIFSGTVLPKWGRQMEGMFLIILYGAYLISLCVSNCFCKHRGMTDPLNKIALAFLAHPDDAEILCAGTLIRLADAGWQIDIATATAGDCGSSTLGSLEIAAIRVTEAAASAGLIGATYHCLHELDAMICIDKPTLRKTHDLFRDIAPGLVFTHAAKDYMIDHEQVSMLARAASFIYAAPNSSSLPLKSGSAVPYLYYCDPIEGIDPLGESVKPTTFVDITEQMPTKEKMLACHASQRQWLRDHHGMDKYLDAMKRHSAVRGKAINRPYAESFVQHRGHAYPQDDLIVKLFKK